MKSIENSVRAKLTLFSCSSHHRKSHQKCNGVKQEGSCLVRTKKKEKKFGACIVWWNKDLGEKLPESRNYRSTRLNELELERVCAGRKKTT
jgi:hypothetical protein